MRILRPVVGAVVVAASLAACSVHPGAAAVVDGRVISQDELQVAQKELAPILVGATASDILAVLIAAPEYAAAASENGVGVSTADAEQLLAEATASAGITEVVDYGPGALDVALFSLANANLSDLADGEDVLAEVQAEVLAQDVTVNPRYGTFDETTGRVELTDPVWIAADPTS
ncbi:hypothetical protein [Actinotalea sp.]|uniref:hypothetical protein n=1 Tax=Actinotalea sp. TaxID=1872145 RepID=UPI003561AC6E